MQAEGERPAPSAAPRDPDPRQIYSIALRIVRKLEKHPGVFTAAALTVYTLGFIIVNVHSAQFRLLTFDLLRGQYVAAGLLFLLFTTAPALAGLLAPLLITHRIRGTVSKSERVKNGCVAAGQAVFLCLFADYGFAYVYDSIVVAPAAHVFNIAFGYGISCNFFGIFGGALLLLDTSENSSMSVSGKEAPDALHPVKKITIKVVGAPMYLIFLLTIVSQFAERVYPGIAPEYGGGGAWIAEILTPESPRGVLPARWRGALLARDDAYLAVIPCPGVLGPKQPQNPVEVRLESVAGWTLLGAVNPQTFRNGKATARCVEAQ